MMKKYNKFVKENIERFDPYGEEEWNDEELNLLYNTVDKSKFKYIFLPNPVLVGYQKNGKECYCNYYYRHVNNFYDEDYLVYNILYDENPDSKKLESRRWKFNLIRYEDFKRGLVRTRPYVKGKFLPEIEIEFDFFPDFLQKISEEVSTIDDVWISECDEVMTESREWSYLCHSNKQIDWERQLYHLKCEIKYHWLLWFSDSYHSIKELEKMKMLGEKAYKKEQEDLLKIANDILGDILREQDQ